MLLVEERTPVLSKNVAVILICVRVFVFAQAHVSSNSFIASIP